MAPVSSTMGASASFDSEDLNRSYKSTTDFSRDTYIASITSRVAILDGQPVSNNEEVLTAHQSGGKTSVAESGSSANIHSFKRRRRGFGGGGGGGPRVREWLGGAPCYLKIIIVLSAGGCLVSSLFIVAGLVLSNMVLVQRSSSSGAASMNNNNGLSWTSNAPSTSTSRSVIDTISIVYLTKKPTAPPSVRSSFAPSVVAESERPSIATTTRRPTTDRRRPTHVPSSSDASVAPTDGPSHRPSRAATDSPTDAPSLSPSSRYVSHDPSSSSSSQSPSINDASTTPTSYPAEDSVHPSVVQTLAPTEDASTTPSSNRPSAPPSERTTLGSTERRSTSPSSTTTTTTTTPSAQPTSSKTTTSPSEAVTLDPTSSPSEAVTLDPTTSLSEAVTLDPTSSPSEAVTLDPTSSPSEAVTLDPTSSPSEAVTPDPTSSPSEALTLDPTSSPSEALTPDPTSSLPTAESSWKPSETTVALSSAPTASSSEAPTTDTTAVSFYAVSDRYGGRLRELERALESLSVDEGEFLVHLGDYAAAEGCDLATHEFYRARLDFSKVPVFVVLGDDEWSDCSVTAAGRDQALDNFRSVFGFYDQKWPRPLSFDVERMAGKPEYFSFVRRRVLFLSVHVVAGAALPDATTDGREEHMRESWGWVERRMSALDGSYDFAVVFGNDRRPNDAYLMDDLGALAGDLDVPSVYVHKGLATTSLSRRSDFLWTMQIEQNRFPFTVVTVDAGRAEEPFAFADATTS